MTDFANKALLPAGLRDVLPPEAAFETHVVESLVAFFAANGYDRVKPPLIEFEEGLLSGAGIVMDGQVFRFMDPVSQRMLGVRADITLQVARIATSRLVKSPRPLRLGYSGQVLRVKGSQLRPERQFAQAGIELIGATSPSADAEVVLLAAESLARLGVDGVSVDLNLPTLVPALCGVLDLDGEKRSLLRRALDQKDAKTIGDFGGGAGTLLGALLAASGPADRAVAALRAIDLPPAAAAARDTLAEVVRLVRAEAPDLTLTVDPVEHRGFEYHAGVSFAIFARGAQGELGRGGRYLAGETAREPATGATLFVDAVLDVLPRPATQRRLLLPPGTARRVALGHQKDGWITVAALGPVADLTIEAGRMGCSHALVEGRPVAVG
ncbi:MAG: ATP phosphoribosyltransferase regulatory subunit [Alphaproteobacteria bacterium]|nr:ATP phosphoribosyltransferase regulatory subunit [Alphaproteobacteria bacterium]MBF0128487.1 ATP phosphoribosyltransferase regulatory subunit [Alphaproteobacteria bacterium]